MVWPVNTRLVEVPPELVSVTVAEYVPGERYVWVVVGVFVVVVVPSPKSQTYEAIFPKATVEAEASKLVGRPASAGSAERRATGA